MKKIVMYEDGNKVYGINGDLIGELNFVGAENAPEIEMLECSACTIGTLRASIKKIVKLVKNGLTAEDLIKLSKEGLI